MLQFGQIKYSTEGGIYNIKFYISLSAVPLMQRACLQPIKLKNGIKYLPPA